MTGRGLFAVLLPTLECNLACEYCFEDRRAGAWDATRALAVVRACIELSVLRRVDDLRLHWQGGEVLMLPDSFFEEVLPLAARWADEAGIRLAQHLHSNLTLYRSSLAEPFRRHLGARIGTSHDAVPGRRTRGAHGERAFERAWRRGLERAEADGLEVGVLATVRPESLRVGAVEVLERLAALGVRRVRFALPFASESGGRGGFLDAFAVGGFLVDAYVWWRDGGSRRGVEVRPFRFLRARLQGLPPDEPGLCVFSGDCASQGFAVDPFGDVYLCDSFVGAGRGTAYGNLFEDSLPRLLSGPRHDLLRRATAELVGERCAGCTWLSICQGGCLVRAGGPATASAGDRYCEAYRALFAAIARDLGEGAEPRAAGTA